jgi:glycosyltransferase involved in cell wall biosynthesis
VKALFLESLPYRSAFRVGSHQYADRFVADGAEVFWLSQPISPLHFVRPEKRDWDERVRAWREGPQRYGGVTYYSPMTLLPTGDYPVLRSGAVTRASASATAPSVTGVLDKEGFGAPDLVWLTNPVFQPLAAKTPGRCLAVRVADDHAAFANVPDAVRELEDAAIEAADVVFAVSQRVFDRLSERREGVVRLPNGVDVEHVTTPLPEPDDLTGLPHPRVLYVGALEYWFDVELVAECARAYPDVPFLVVGPDPLGLAERGDAPNLRFLGPRGYDEVPAYLQHCDVALVPFARDELVDAVHPIKVYEYLAAGLRVVAVRWTELELMDAPIDLADRAGFSDTLGAALADPASGRDERTEFARANSWDVRYRVVRDALDGCLAAR